MRKIITCSAVALILAAGSALADPGGGNGHGGGGGGAPGHGQGKSGGGAPGNQGHGPERGGGMKMQAQVQHKAAPKQEMKRAPAPVDHRSSGGGKDHGPPAKAEHKVAAPERHGQPAADHGQQRIDMPDAAKARDWQDRRGAIKDKGDKGAHPLPAGVRRIEYSDSRGRSIFVPTSDRVHIVTNRRDYDWGKLYDRPRYMDGCPPGLAKKNNGCIPPGLDRPDTYSWSRPSWYFGNWSGQRDYRFIDGSLMRLSPANAVLSYIPLLGGALSVGQVWPGAYSQVALPDYYTSYYDLGPTDGYRYYDNTIYRVDPTTSAITSIAALLTGNDISIGQPMPAGYDVYNVPYRWRDQYRDGPDAYYRYSDGYIYQLDPTTRLVQAAIELLS